MFMETMLALSKQKWRPLGNIIQEFSKIVNTIWELLRMSHKTSPGDVFDAKNGHVNDGRMTQQNSFDVQSADLVTSRPEKSKIT